MAQCQKLKKHCSKKKFLKQPWSLKQNLMEQLLMQKSILKLQHTVRCDRDRKGEWVPCYIKHDICFSIKNIISKNIEVILVDLLLPKTKPISIGVVYGPPKDINFLQLFAEILNSINISKN